jgi:DNA (cytosine-5)-methyltransferase 1
LEAGEHDQLDPWHRAARLSDQNLARLRATPKNGGDRGSWRDTPLQLDAYRGKPNQFANVYGRMAWDRPAATLTTRFNSLSNGRFGHPDEDRAISVREGATLQTFPPDYQFVGNMGSVCRQIGNAVPPRVGEAIGQHLLACHEALAMPPVRAAAVG